MARMLRIHHVAFAHDGERAPQDRFADLLGIEVCHSEDVDGFVERMMPIGDGFLQTLEVTGPGVVDTFVRRRGSALHHIAIEVDDIETLVAELRERGVRLVDEQPRPGGMGTTIAFIHPSEFDGILVELVEVPRGQSE